MAQVRRAGKKGVQHTGARTRGVVRSTIVKSGVKGGKKGGEQVGVGVVEVHGYLAPREVAAIRNAIHDFEGRRVYCVVLDMGDVSGMNMLCLAHLVDQMWELRERGGDLRLVSVPDAVSSVLHDIGADQLFTCYASREEARRWSTTR